MELADDIKAVADMSAVSAADGSSTSSSSVSTGTLTEKPEDDTTPGEGVADTVTTPDMTATVTLAPPPVTVAEKRVCPEDSADTDQISPDVEKMSSNEAMISPNTKVYSVFHCHSTSGA